MIRFFKHILKVAFGVGLLMGVLLFSVLLYLSDFTKAPESVEAGGVGVAAESSDEPLTPASEELSFNKRFLTWVFGAEEQASP